MTAFDQHLTTLVAVVCRGNITNNLKGKAKGGAEKKARYDRRGGDNQCHVPAGHYPRHGQNPTQFLPERSY